MPESTLPVNAATHVEPPVSTERALAATNLAELLQKGTREEKRRVLYLLLHSLLGERVERELAVEDIDGFLYAFVLSPGKREALRLLEDPERARRLEEVPEETIPLSEVLHGIQSAK